MTVCNNCAIVQDLMPEVLKFTVRCEDCIKYMVAAERERLARVFDEEAEVLPLGVEDPQKGQSIYNWLKYAAMKIREA